MQNLTTRALMALLLVLPLGGCERGSTTAGESPRAAGAAPSQASRSNADSPGASHFEAAQRAYASTDFATALEHFIAAGEQGNVDAQYYAGLMFEEGEGTARNYAEAAKWFEKAAAQNHPDALYALARFHAIGVGVEMDVAKAAELYGRAAQAYPAGEKRDLAIQQQKALLALIAESRQAADARPN